MKTEERGELDPRIRIRAPLRCDGVGSLDCAEDTETGMRMAVRWLPLSANGEAAAQAMERLPRHEALPRIRQTGRVGASAFVAMDFPEGRLLSTFDAPLPPDRIVPTFAALASALAALHEVGTVHGELSPESVLVLPEGRALLWDVPLVTANRLTDRRGEERAMQILVRAAPYLSPERARGMPTSAAADVYALGATLCHAAGGPAPGEHNALAVVHRVATGQWRPEPPASLPAEVRELVERMLSNDPLARLSARDVAEGLAQLAAVEAEEPAEEAAPLTELPVTPSEEVAALEAEFMAGAAPPSETEREALEPTAPAVAIVAPPDDEAPVELPPELRRRSGPLLAAGAGSLALAVAAVVWTMWPAAAPESHARLQTPPAESVVTERPGTEGIPESAAAPEVKAEEEGVGLDELLEPLPPEQRIREAERRATPPREAVRRASATKDATPEANAERPVVVPATAAAPLPTPSTQPTAAQAPAPSAPTTAPVAAPESPAPPPALPVSGLKRPQF